MREATAQPLVLHVIPTATARGAQVEARAMADALDGPSRRHRVLCLFDGEGAVDVDIALRHPAGAVPGRGFDPRLARRLRGALAEHAPAVVVAHGGEPLKYLVPAMAGRRRPLAYYAIGTVTSAVRRPARRALWRVLVGRADVVACEGQEVLDECRSLLGVSPARLVLAPNCRDPEVFHPGAPRVGASTPVVTFVGALTSGKRPEWFVSVVAAVRAEGGVLRALLVGDGPNRDKVTGPARAAGIEVLGARNDIPALLRDTDVLVFPSLPEGEGMPGVLIEAGMSGVPVVASDVPGVRSVVADGETGIVVGATDHAAMVEATSGLVADAARRRAMGAAAVKRCRERFGLDVVAARWQAFLEPLLDGRR